ncbi:MAG: diguanylate cyclase [Thiopseudomonas sp.]|nr:diguanylate cyclase [Thiopseudomonas sp.]
MTQTSSNLQVKILQLRANFIKQLPKRLLEVEECIKQAENSTNYDELIMGDLFRAFHSLKGASSSFGFDKLAEEAAIGEHLAQGLITTSAVMNANRSRVLADVIEQLNLEMEELKQVDLSFDRPYRSPSFEMGQINRGWQEQGAPLIYICDDETEQVVHLDYQLSCFGYRIQRFTDVESFEATVFKQAPDAVVMDVHFPQSSIAGTETLRRVNETLGRQLPAIVLSGQDSFAGRLSAFRAGCRSYFTKPARPLELAAALDDLLKNKHVEPLRILIVDDEPEVAQYHSLILEDAGMLVQQVHEPALALDVLRNFSPDLILIDVYMPECTGQELAGIIRMVPEYLGMPIVYLSSETDRKKQFSAMQVGVEGFITKPVVPSELVSAVALRAERMRTLRRLMTRDSLTGLFNHSSTKEIIESAVSQVGRTKENLIMVMLDLDYFKKVNDKHGHLAGDQVLVALSRVLKHRLRNTDVIGRYGGEEFAILLRKISIEQAYELIDTLREDFSKIIFSSGAEQFTCTFSAGLSSFAHYGSVEELIGAADVALYQAKKDGRNRVNVDRKSQ